TSKSPASRPCHRRINGWREMTRRGQASGAARPVPVPKGPYSRDCQDHGQESAMYIPSQYRQHTLNGPIGFVGPGLHSGQTVSMVIHPAPADSGRVFVRQDVPEDRAEIQARWNTVTDTRLSTTVSNRFGVKVATIEHLMAALHASGVDNARIVLNGPEVPILDGSSEPFMRLIRQTGLCPQ